MRIETQESVLCSNLENEMCIVGWPEVPDDDGAILPVAIVDVDFDGTPDEIACNWQIFAGRRE